MKINNISQFDNCANCGACLNVCPVGAISINETGYYYTPQVDGSLCLSCGKCVSCCPVNNSEKAQNLISAYAGYCLDDKILSESSSGGAFYAISQTVLSKGGIVFGAVFSEDNKKVVFENTDEVPLCKIQKANM